ncbi:MAG: Ldh family oxidoreductase [Lentisphaerae bacterium]|nr:Ldh family oxidoreductase [Lentisphaerota bacterium]
MSTLVDVHIEATELKRFCGDVFESLRLEKGDAVTAADVLVSADLRGIPSHGVGRLWRYVNGLRGGQMIPDACAETVSETDMSIVVDAKGQMGAPVSVRTMEAVIHKASEQGTAFGCVRNSNHFGIAGYYAMMALPHDMIGLTMTNTAALGVPTFGRQVMFGTNPLAFAVPADREEAFVLDMSTTVVSRGKLEVYDREAKELPMGWAVDKSGQTACDPGSILEDMFHRIGGGILPLGGINEEHGGYKGYGLAVMVDILCAVLGGAPCGPAISDTETTSARVSHFFGAIRIDRFRDAAGFRSDMDAMLAQLRSCPPAEGQEQVYYAGQKERLNERAYLEHGIPINGTTYSQLLEAADEQGVTPPSIVAR